MTAMIQQLQQTNQATVQALQAIQATTATVSPAVSAVPKVQQTVTVTATNSTEAPGPVPATATSTATFCATPSVHNIDQCMDYTTKDGANLYKLASAPLKTKFDLSAANTLVFIDQLRDRAQEVGWDAGFYQITKYNVAATGTPAILKDLFTQYGQIPVNTIRAKVMTWKAGGAKANSRSTQNNMAFYKCLKDSLTDEAYLRILPHQHEYMDQDGTYHAPLLYKTIMRLATIDSKATSAVLRDNLYNLDAKMVQLNSNILEFHLYFSTNYNQLLGHGEAVDSPVHLLFKAYKAVQDSKFVITQKEEEYFEDKNGAGALTYEEIFAMATNKYNALIAQGRWGAKSPSEQKIVALTSQMETLKGDLKLSKDLISKLKKKDPRKEVDVKKKKKETNKERQKRDEKWKRTPPRTGEKHTKKHNKTTYHWCPHHDAWVMHKPDECRANPTHPDYKAPRATTPPPARTQVAHAAEIMDQLAALSMDL